ncbi:DoxX family protein [Pandoraea anhela]|uniref:Membrane protein n=1 Tax=Pandoraea anhela TaxID=2508295 RepID=A0A5E4Y5V2_9BURK|nr:DoxX family protein [Pandoraea anhela]VVE43705.1 membrane protein [Pandoraea anhela]
MHRFNIQWVARVLMSALFLIGGIRKILAFKATVGYFSAIGLPFAEVVTALVILIEAGGAIALILGWRLKPLALGLAIYTVATAFIGHRFWVADPAQFSGQLNHFFKNIAIAGGFLLLAAPSNASDAKA